MKKLCIEVSDDGQVSVGLEPPMEEPGGMGGEPPQDDYMQPVGSLDEAFEAARELLSSPEQDAADAEGNEAFASGFQGTASPEMLSSRGLK